MATDLVTKALTNLYSLYQDERELMQFVNQEKEKVESNLSAMVTVLEDAEEKQLKGTSRGLDDWLKKMENAVYVVDDILDDCFTEALRDKYEGDRSCSFLSFLHPDRIMFRHNISARMKAIRKKLDIINQEKIQFSLVPTVPHDANVPHNILEERLTSSCITEDFICGRDQEKEDLVRLLLEDGTQHAENLSVYSIVAMGGLGKTTLAKLVYNDERVQDHFQLKIWICVSVNFEMKSLIKGIVGSSQTDDDNLDSLQKKLRDMLGGKKYMLVLDDVWNENWEKWIQLRSLLSCGVKGSSILVTTRQRKIAITMETPPIKPYDLEPLSDDASWKIFRKRAFGLSVANETENLIAIGKEIVKKCKGVPLVAKVLGSLLSFRSDEEYWLRLRDSELWNISDGKDPIFGPLKLSYLNLPLQIRRCFCYCAVFPKDYQIEKVEIIQLWMANGFIPSKGMIDMEDIGNDIVRELEWRSLIEDVEKDEFGVTERFKIHDLFHDLAHYITGDDMYVADETSSKDLLTRSILHISDNVIVQDNVANGLRFHVKGLRSYINLQYGNAWIADIFSEPTSLRVLNLQSSDLSKLPSSIGHPVYLKHLRYLNLSDTRIEELPKFICSLWNLQTLKLIRCSNLKALPDGLGCLKNLRHLYIKGCLDLSSIPRSIGGLTSLRTLDLVIVGEVGESGFQISALGRLKSVKGEMKIMHLERLREVKDAQEANLMEKRDLTRLTLTWEGENDKDQQLQVQILEALRPSPKLTHLEVSGYGRAVFPQWMMKEITSFMYIKSLILISCKNCRPLPALWRLPSLKTLKLKYLDSLKWLIEGERDSDGQELMCVGFPSLTTLTLEYLSDFEGVLMQSANDMNNNHNLLLFPRLYRLTIFKCPKSSFSDLGPLPRLRYLDIDDIAALPMFCNHNSNVQILNSVREFTISGSSGSLQSFPDRMLQGLSSLRKLIICSFPNLKSLPEGFKYLSSLQDLMVQQCDQLVDISNAIYLLPSLESVTFLNCDIASLGSSTSTSTTGLAGLPQDIPHRLPVLRHLALSWCFNLKAMPEWLSEAIYLQEINIFLCPKLKSIPNSFQGLTNLKRLSISCCPELSRRCRKETGEDWNNIKHVPDIDVDDEDTAELSFGWL